MVKNNLKRNAYYQNKIIYIEVNCMDDLRKLEKLEDRPVIVRFNNSFTIEYQDEYEKEIFYLKALYERLDKLESKKQRPRVIKEINEIHDKIDQVISSTLGEEEAIRVYSANEREHILDALSSLRTTFKERKDFKPIDLSGRKSDILIEGRGHFISGIKISKDSNAALFTGVNCDIDIRNLSLFDIDIKGIYNAASLICGVGEESSNPTITLTDVTIRGNVTSKFKASELISNLNGNLIARGVHCGIFLNYEFNVVEILNNYKLKAQVSSYFNESDLSKSQETNVYYRRPKNNQTRENE